MVAGSVGAYENKIVKNILLYTVRSLILIREHTTMYYDICNICVFYVILFVHYYNIKKYNSVPLDLFYIFFFDILLNFDAIK